MSSIAEEESTAEMNARNDDICDTDCFIMSAIFGDVMHLHKALKQLDKEEFLKTMVWEISMHQKIKNWKIFLIKEVPENIKILDLVWSMRRKRKICMG